MNNIEMVPVSQIIVEDRQRKQYEDIEELAQSITKHGLLNPLTIDDNNRLLAGGRRLTALLLLGRTDIPCIRKNNISLLQAKEIELEENLQRSDLTWQEQQAAIAEIHRIKMQSDKNWTAEKTAEMIGKKRRTVFNALALDRALVEHPEIKLADTPHGAMLKLERIKQVEERKEAVKVAQLADKFGMMNKSSHTVTTYQGDALEFFEQLESDSADIIFTNPPFGVNIEGLFKGNKKIYSDEPQKIWSLLSALYPHIYRVLKPNRWFITFWPTSTLELGKQLLAESGFTFDPVPFIWVKPNKRVTAMGDPYSDANIQYESFFFAKKGSPKWAQIPLGNVITCDTPDSDRLHPLQMPPEVWQEILPYISFSGERAYEPFSGSGSGGIACQRLGINYEGVELDPDYYEKSQLWLAEEKLGIRSSHPPTSEAADD
jgi:ParB/RepB/Spo0J family partition protein